jgi:hypothetical protein
MPVSRLLPAAVLLGFAAAWAAPGFAAPAAPIEPGHRPACLSKTEQRAAVAAHKAIPLAQAIKSLRARGLKAELVRARLCRHGDGLGYVLTLLARSGKVTRATIDAASGEVVGGR